MKKSSGCPKDPKEYEIIMCPQFLTAQPEPAKPRGPGEAQGSCLVSFQFLQTSAQTNPRVYSKAPISPCVYQRLKCKGGSWLGGGLREAHSGSAFPRAMLWTVLCGTDTVVQQLRCCVGCPLPNMAVSGSKCSLCF